MRYVVDWEDPALDEVADLWTRAVNRQAVSDAVNRVDGLLTYDPETRGVDFYGDRLLVEPPLHVVFRVIADNRRVVVIHVW
jgi:hypothetical protein